MPDGHNEDTSGDAGDATNVVPIKGAAKDGGGKLTAKQQGFVNSILAGANQVTAYRGNYSTDGMANKTCWEAASRLFANSKVSARIKAGQRRQEEVATHSGASLRLHVEKELFELTTKADSDQAKLRALELLGKLDKVGAFTERVNVGNDNRTEEEVLAELQAKLDAAFGGLA